jgi:hypothetical protein
LADRRAGRLGLGKGIGKIVERGTADMNVAGTISVRSGPIQHRAIEGDIETEERQTQFVVLDLVRNIGACLGFSDKVEYEVSTIDVGRNDTANL